MFCGISYWSTWCWLQFFKLFNNKKVFHLHLCNLHIGIHNLLILWSTECCIINWNGETWRTGIWSFFIFKWWLGRFISWVYPTVADSFLCWVPLILLWLNKLFGPLLLVMARAVRSLNWARQVKLTFKTWWVSTDLKIFFFPFRSEPAILSSYLDTSLYI